MTARAPLPLISLAAAIAMFGVACRTPLPPPVAMDEPVIDTTAEEETPEGNAYIGLALRDLKDGDGALVSWIMPGPLNGEGSRSPHMNRGDVIVSANGEAIATGEDFIDLVKRSEPGDEVTIEVRRTEGNPHAAMPTPGPGTRLETFTVALAAKTDWTGPVGTPRPEDRRNTAGQFELGSTAAPLDRFLQKALRKRRLDAPVAKLVTLLRDTQAGADGFNGLSRVNAAFRHPTRLPELVRGMSRPMTDVPGSPEAIMDIIAENLDAAAPDLSDPVDLSTPADALVEARRRLGESRALLSTAFAKVPKDALHDVPRGINDFLNRLSVKGQGADRIIRALRTSMAVDFDALVAAAAPLTGFMSKSPPPAATTPAVPLPAALRGKVRGTILAAAQCEGAWLVFGGPGNNEYTLSAIDVVIDAGGDDTYRCLPRHGAGRVQLLVDMAGNDTYAGGNLGPAGTHLGISLLVDYAGNDRYRGRRFSCGSALLGVGVLLDHAGADEYQATDWSIGCGLYGAGVVLDLGGSPDVYWAHHASEGIGGPRGFGLLLDQGGKDLYRANGPTASAYGDRATFYGLSQGVGYGFRGYDTGGIGVLSDLGGNDRYEAGEFSQGGGYYWGLGLLDDRTGDDLYYGHRYSQGFGCHQAVGALVDREGNDTYWATTAAGQGAAWDIGIGLLFDAAGDDHYRADDLCQGSAAMQGIAWLIDAAGSDHYVASSPRSQGQSWGNSYHYERTECMSWSVLLDAGGTPDHYSTGRRNGKTLSTGQFNKADPRNSTVYGLFVDTPRRVSLGE